MASLRRSKTLSPDGQTARFLYTIIKQLDLKTVDWNEVAGNLDITNGHAARMRFSRFKQHIEGTPTQPRAPRPKKDGEKATKGKGKGKGGKRALEEEAVKGEAVKDEPDEKKAKVKHEAISGLKQEDGAMVKQEAGAVLKQEPGVRVKQEPGLQDVRSEDGQRPVVKIKREPTPEQSTQQPISATAAQPPTPPGLANNEVFPTSLPLATAAAIAANGQVAPPALPPLATVSLADLQLPPKSKAPMFTAPRGASNYVLQTNPHPIVYPASDQISRIKMEPDMAPRMLQYSPVIVKKEVVDV